MELSIAYSSSTFIECATLSPLPAATMAWMLPALRYTMDSTAKMRIAISASFSFISPKSPICLPKALRSRVYFEAVASTCLAPPTQLAPRVKRPEFRMLKATMWPRPISCSRFSLGTLQFSRNTGVVELPWIPILCSSLPGLQFAQAVGADQFSGGQLRQVLLLLFFGAEIDDGQGSDARVGAVRHREPAVQGELFGQHRGGDLVQARASVFLGHPAPHEPELAALADQLRHQPRLL